jgi:hypothetical protein
LHAEFNSHTIYLEGRHYLTTMYSTYYMRPNCGSRATWNSIEPLMPLEEDNFSETHFYEQIKYKSIHYMESMRQGSVPPKILVCLPQENFLKCSDGLRAGWLGFDSRQVLEIFLCSRGSIPALGPTQPPIQWVLCALSLGVRRQCRVTHLSLPSSAKVK